MSDEYPLPDGPGDGDDSRLWAALCHLAALSNFIGSPILGLIVTVVIWMVKRDEHPFVNEQGRESINFQVTYFILYLIFGLFSIILIGIPFLMLTVLAQLILGIIAAIKTYSGEHYRYPFIFRFI